MEKNRLEAFRDGVITVLEIKLPYGDDLVALQSLIFGLEGSFWRF